jgi:hypothetical protein
MSGPRSEGELIHEHHTHIRTPDGLVYLPRTYAMYKGDGIWQAWLEFHPLESEGLPVLRTDRETTQATREAAGTWAAGLERAYFDGAFARAHLVDPA